MKFWSHWLVYFFVLITDFAANNVLAQLPGYRVLYGLTKPTPQQIVLRQWQQAGRAAYLTVNPQTLETRITSMPSGSFTPLAWNEVLQRVAQTPYGRAMKAEQKRSGSLQDAGIERADTTERGFSLTIDLCPSTKPLTRQVFDDLIRAFEPDEKPIPVTITVSGLWINSHQDDLRYLKNLATRGDLTITWVNHSYHHRFDPRRPLPMNFLLETGTNVSDEVLLNEQDMIRNGLLPSIFFRFPGLISDKSLFGQVLAFGLLPIGSDAWLAKNQSPKSGSFVLIHANGNEPLGITDFIRLIQEHDASIKNKSWLLYELPTSVARTEGK
ncbi:polysaccharide deacetylase family protein [Spirosoma harenae]